MFDTIKTIREAFDVPSWAFILILASLGFALFGVGAWVVDRVYQKGLHPPSAPPVQAVSISAPHESPSPASSPSPPPSASGPVATRLEAEAIVNGLIEKYKKTTTGNHQVVTGSTKGLKRKAAILR